MNGLKMDLIIELIVCRIVYFLLTTCISFSVFHEAINSKGSLNLARDVDIQKLRGWHWIYFGYDLIFVTDLEGQVSAFLFDFPLT